MLKKNDKVLVIGGSSGMGLEVACQALVQGASVVIAGRTKERLDEARQKLGDSRVQAFAADIGNKEQVKELFDRVGDLDHLVITAADLPYGPTQNLSEQELMRAVHSKFLGPVFAVQHAAPRLSRGASITFISGIASIRPIRGGAMAAAMKGSLEALARALAIELAPVRVNAVSPGWTDTPIWDRMPGMTPERKKERLGEMSARLPVGRIGDVRDIAAAVLFLMNNGFVTGTVVHVDGGHQLV